MAFSSCLCSPQIFLKTDRHQTARIWRNSLADQRSATALGCMRTEVFMKQVRRMEDKLHSDWFFVGGSKLTFKPQPANIGVCRKGSHMHVACCASSQIASSVFTIGTAAVLPFYTLMVVAPRARLTRKLMDSSIPYVVLGALYAYLLFLSWTPDTVRYMFASKYMLPELSGIAKMFSSEMTLASAWIHLLTIDLFAARHIFHDGLENEVETRHSVSLCLLFCPIGIIAHVATKALTSTARK